MEMNKKMFDIKTKMKALLTEARILKDNGDCEKASTKMDEYDALKADLAFETRMLSEQAELTADDTKKAVPASVLEGEKKPDSDKEFAEAFRKGFPVDKAIMVEGTPASAGYLVPQDIQTRINRYNEAFFDFSEYINVEPVSTNTGTRVYAKKANDFAFQQVTETGEIPLTAVPEYEPVTYNIKDYGGIVPVSRNLMNDSDQNIISEVAMWFAKGKRGTVNSQVIALVKQNTANSVENIDDIQRLLLVALGAAYNGSAKIFTNDDGLAWLASLEDGVGRKYMMPDPKVPERMQIAIGAKAVPVVTVPNAVLPSAVSSEEQTVEGETVTVTTTVIPLFIGDLKAGITCFDRQQMTIASSDTATVGSGASQLNAFSQRLILFRACQRMDFKAVDTDAYLNCTVTLTTTA